VNRSARRRLAHWFAGLVLAEVVALVAIKTGAQDSEPLSPSAPAPVRYVISLAGAPQHLLKVKLLLAPGAAARDLQLPVWNALYQIRDFAQYVNWVRGRDNGGHPLTVSKVDKSRWRLSGAEGGAEIEYEILADQSGPFGAQLNAHHAFFNLAEILMYPVDALASPMQVRFADVPSGWRIATALPTSSEKLSAENYDRLVDSPVEIGSFQETDFDEGGGHYRVVVDADAADYDMQTTVSTLRRLAASAADWMKDRPFQTYLFIYHFPRGPAGGGMEHAYSTAIDISAKRLADNPSSLGDLTAHEFFHLWNVKRIRPQSLEPIDYTKENYTRALWFSEGVTTTAGNIIQMRAGLLDETRDLKGLAAEIGELERRPAHLTQSVEESSLDAWLEKYDYYRLPARSISYYNKGYLLGVLLDLQVREASRDSASLRDVFLVMNQNARKGQFFSDSEGVRQAAEFVSHADLGWFFQKYVAGTEEIPWDEVFITVGLHLVRRVVAMADPGFVAVHNFDAAPAVASVAAGSEAERAGLAVGDDILEINSQAAGSDFEQRLTELRPGDTLHLRVRNSGGERELHWQLGHREEVAFELKDVDNITAQQRARRAAWLKGESEMSAESRP
jgi:predicted metalloprotease with PDZ domain